jgi:hypothetical protein
MILTIKLSTGKTIELKPREVSELMQAISKFYTPVQEITYDRGPLTNSAGPYEPIRFGKF